MLVSGMATKLLKAEHILIINKPAHISISGNRTFKSSTQTFNWKAIEQGELTP